MRASARARIGRLNPRGAREGRRKPDEPDSTAVVAERVESGVLEIHLAGGERRNVLGRSTVERIESLVTVPPNGTRVILITADPPDFCAGYDLVEAARGDAEQLIANDTNFASLRHAAVPIVVALHGHVIGGGLELALAADVRLASPETRFSIPASKLGLVYSEAGVRLVVEELGESAARALFLAGRVITADSALATGLLTEIVGRDQLRDRALELATTIASWSAEATAGNRRVLDVVAGRVAADTAALRLASFAPDGVLAESIARFTARRKEAPPPARRSEWKGVPRRVAGSTLRRLRRGARRLGTEPREVPARAQAHS